MIRKNSVQAVRVPESACYGTFLTYASPVSSVFSGVWLASVSQWAKNQRAFLEAGAAGHPGPTVLGPVGLEPRVQRGADLPNRAQETRSLQNSDSRWH